MGRPMWRSQAPTLLRAAPRVVLPGSVIRLAGLGGGRRRGLRPVRPVSSALRLSSGIRAAVRALFPAIPGPVFVAAPFGVSGGINTSALRSFLLTITSTEKAHERDDFRERYAVPATAPGL